jgi:NAD(P)-dependent dehydrogenase (short-subunit alcohol dehydrogenase family)
VRNWLITGCSTGFGRALVGLLLDRGDRVVATARQPATMDALIASHPERALALKLDVTKPDEIKAAIAAARARFGPIDVLVNNAGYGDMGTVEETSVEVARAIMETNLFGAVNMIRGVVTEMRKRRSGQIVNIGSVANLVGFPALGYYCASKFALAGLTESLAAELGPLGVKVTIAELGPFATEFANKMKFNLPMTPDYDLASLARTAGSADWGPGDDPVMGAAALLAVLDAPSPPVHFLVGRPGMTTVALHDERRLLERSVWREASELSLASASRNDAIARARP